MARKFTSKSKPIKKSASKPKQISEPNEETQVKPETPQKQNTESAQPAKDQKTSSPSEPTTNPDVSLKTEKSQDSTLSVPQVNESDELNIEKETGFLKEEPREETEKQPLIEEITSEQINKKNYKLFIGGLLLGSIIAAFTIGYFYLQLNEGSAPPSATPPAISSNTPKTETQAIFNRSDWSLEILNGSTKAGAASKLATALENLGYKISRTGNADNKDYKNSVVSLGADFEKHKEDLLKDLDGQIIVPSETQSLKGSTASAQIIIGQDE